MQYKSYLVEQNVNILDKKVVLLYGENLGLKNDIRNKLKLANRGKKLIILNQEEIIKNEDTFFNEINNFSLFEKEKIFFVDNVNDKFSEIINKIDVESDNLKIYLFANLLEKKSKIRNIFEKSGSMGVIACYADNELSIKKIILNKLKGYTGLTNYNLNLILENSNLDRVKLNNELEKIITYFQDKNIKTEVLKSLMDNKINENFNLLRDAALIGNKDKTGRLLTDTVIEPELAIFYLNLINQRLLKLYEIKSAPVDEKIENKIAKLVPPIFWKDKPSFILQYKKWSEDKIKNVLKITQKLEIDLKSNSFLNKNILIKKLMVDICCIANS